jgi:hypothetical protein
MAFLYNGPMPIKMAWGFFVRLNRWVMSKELLSIFLDELATVRIVCQKSDCGAVTEVPLASLAKLFAIPKEPVCPHCGQDFRIYQKAGTGVNPFPALAEAVANLLAIDGRVKLEFAIETKKAEK